MIRFLFKDLTPVFFAYKKQSLWLFLALILSVITLIAGIGLLSVSGWFITATAIVGSNLALARSFNFLTPGAVVRGFSISRTSGRYFERLVSHEATFRVLTELRVNFFTKITPRASTILKKFRQTDLLNRLVADIDTLDHLYLRFLSPILSASLILCLLAATTSYLTNWPIWYYLGFFLILLGLFLFAFYKMGNRAGVQIAQQKSYLRTSMMDYVSGLKELEIYAATDQQLSSIEAEQTKLIAGQKQMSDLTGLAASLMSVCSTLIMLVVLCLATPLVISGHLPGPIFAMFLFMSLALFETLAPLPSAFQFLGQTRFSLRRLNEISQMPCIKFPPTENQLELSAKIEFSKVSFAHKNLSVLNQLSLTVKPREHVALLGPTGCGKSTLVSLLCRQFDPDSGSLLLGGHPVNLLSEKQLCNQVAVMPQKVDIFNGTLADNLRLVNSHLKDHQLIDVLNEVGLDYLAPADKLLAIWVGQSGIKLSGGEIKRVAIARILLSQATIILLDEPTEGLDSRSEDNILRLIMKFCQGKTLIFITHRLVALTHMHRVCLMDQGSILEQGSHKALMTKNKAYASLINTRLGP